jgi:hypothetical protein
MALFVAKHEATIKMQFSPFCYKKFVSVFLLLLLSRALIGFLLSRERQEIPSSKYVTSKSISRLNAFMNDKQALH